MKARLFLVAALPAALLLCNTQVTSASPASTTRHAHGNNGDEAYIVIRYRDQAELQRISTRFQHLVVDKRARTAKVEADAGQMDELRRMGVKFDIDRNGTMQLRSFNQNMRAGRFGARAISGYTCYRTVEETHTSMAQLATNKPTLATVTNIGPTWLKWQNNGGYDMRVLRITNSATNSLRPNKPAMVLLSSIHAREYTPAELNMRFGEWLVNNYGTDAEATWLLDNYVFYLIPQGNPDGRKKAETGLSWRKNVNNSNGGSCSANSVGVDINRNFPFRWNTVNGGSSGDPCQETYRGPSAGSEQESKNIINLVAGTPGATGAYSGGIFPDRRADSLTSAAPDDTQGLYIDIHSSGKLVLWPWGMTTSLAPNGTALQTFGRRLAFFNGHSPEQSVGLYATDGATDDNMYGHLGVPSYTFELGTQFFESCSSFTGTVLPDNLAALRYAARNLTAPYRWPSGPNTVSVSASSASVAAGTPVTISAVLNDSQFRQTNGTEATQNITSARVYIDTPPWETGAGSGIAMNASDGSFNSTVETVTASVPTTGLSAGRHIFYVQGTDASGKVGTPNAVLVTVTSGGGGGNVAPVANFTVSTSSLTATFTDTSTDSDGSIASRSWNFGDGTTSTLANPTKTYATAGTYDVTLTVTDNGGLTHTKTTSVTVGSANCGGSVLCNGTTVSVPNRTSGFSPAYTFVVPAGKTSVTFNLTGSTTTTGDADMYVNLGSALTTPVSAAVSTSTRCVPYRSGNTETCTFNAPTAGTYYITVNAYSAFTGVSLRATMSP